MILFERSCSRTRRDNVGGGGARESLANIFFKEKKVRAIARTF